MVSLGTKLVVVLGVHFYVYIQIHVNCHESYTKHIYHLLNEFVKKLLLIDRGSTGNLVLSRKKSY
jgi:hypothetical protein